VEGVYESLYVLAPSGVVDPIRLGGPFHYSRSPSSLISICTENLMSFGLTYEEVRRQCPGLARSGFHVSTKRLYMTNCARETVPTCVYLNHTWDYFTDMWIWSREIFSRMRSFYT
jgi:Fe2+ or Zn2+ uptake regulation protein